MGKPEKRPFRRLRLRWEYNIKMGHQEVRSAMDCLDLAEDGTGGGLFLSAVINFWVL